MSEYRFMSTNGHEIIIDEADRGLVESQGGWRARKCHNTHYAKRTLSLGIENGKRVQKELAIHRLLLPEARLIDHINGNGLDNRRANLRPASALDNAINQGLRKDNTSGVRGVYLHKPTRQWYARIRVDGKLKYIGSYLDLDAAKEAWFAAAREAWGAETVAIIRGRMEGEQ